MKYLKTYNSILNPSESLFQLRASSAVTHYGLIYLIDWSNGLKIILIIFVRNIGVVIYHTAKWFVERAMQNNLGQNFKVTKTNEFNTIKKKKINKTNPIR